MLTNNDLRQVQDLIKEETTPLQKKVDSIENNLDKVLKIVTDTQQELTIIASKLQEHLHNKAIHHTHSDSRVLTPSIYA